MKSIPFGKHILAGCTLALVASCGDATAPVDPALTDALQQFSVADNFGAIGAPLGTLFVPPVSMSSACPLDPATKRFVCPARTSQSMTTKRYYELLDAAGAAQTAWGASIVAIRTVNDLSGTMSYLSVLRGMQITLTISIHDDATLSGLKDERQTLNGLATQTIGFPDDGPPSTMTRTTTNLVLPKKGEQYPLSGSIASSLGSGSDAFVTTMTFNGTSTVTFTSTMFGTTKTCTINLATTFLAFCP